MKHIQFNKTELTLLQLLAQHGSGEDEFAWRRFFEQYYPAMVKYAELFCDAANAEDIVQKVLIKLVEALRQGRYQRKPKTSFRAYLKTLIRNEFVDWHRHETARGDMLKVSLDRLCLEAPVALPPEQLDAQWRIARRMANIEHVLAQTMLDKKICRAYREHVLSQRPAAEVAKELGVSVRYVYLAKSRINRRVVAIEELYGE